jgi:hypothetical protein
MAQANANSDPSEHDPLLVVVKRRTCECRNIKQILLIVIGFAIAAIFLVLMLRGVSSHANDSNSADEGPDVPQSKYILMGWMGMFPRGLPPVPLDTIRALSSTQTFWVAIGFAEEYGSAGQFSFSTSSPEGQCGHCGIVHTQCRARGNVKCLVSLLGDQGVLKYPIVSDTDYHNTIVSSLKSMMSQYSAIGVELNFERFDSKWTTASFANKWCSPLKDLITQGYKVVVSPYAQTDAIFTALVKQCPDSVSYVAVQCYVYGSTYQTSCEDQAIKNYGASKLFIGLNTDKTVGYLGTGSVQQAKNLVSRYPQTSGVAIFTWESDNQQNFEITKQILTQWTPQGS